VTILLTAPAIAWPSSALERIRDRQVIVFAYRSTASPFSFAGRDGRVLGYSVELCTRIAAAIQRQLNLRQLRIEWLPVDADTRMQAVTSGRADAECGTTTISLSRMERVDFSVPIFVDGATLAVTAQSGIKSLADVNGRRVAVIRGTTTERALVAALRVADVTATLVPIARLEDGAVAVREGRADAYAGDRIVLTKLLLESGDGSVTLLPEDFSFEPYAIVVPRDDSKFRLAVNRALVDTYKRGDIDAIFQKWLAPLGRPSALMSAMFYLSMLPD
jgi:polar amino acid transport system substrate-binding protein/glutamate/aspartate transport system substrate-binding protein